MNISLESYKVFYYVAKNLSFSKAAEQLFISQSAVSQSIKKLEEKLAFDLMIRTTKSIQLTIDGEILYSHLVKAFELIYSAEKKLISRQKPYSGEIVIASTDTLCKYFLLPKIKEITTLYPKIKFKIINGTSLNNLELLEKAAVDIAVINIPENIDKDIFVINKEYSFKDVFVISKNAEIKAKLTLEEISTFPLIVLDNKSVTRKFLDDLFNKINISISPEIELQNVDVIIEMAKAGLGISFIPDICLIDEELKIINVVETIPDRKFGVVSLKQLPLLPIANTFLNIFN